MVLPLGEIRMKNLTLMMGLILIPLGIFSATITGIISDNPTGTSAGSPLMGAKVVLTTGSAVNGKGPRLDSSITDSLGKYSLHVDSAGLKQLLVYMAGHYPINKYVSVEKDTGTYVVNIDLKPISTRMNRGEGNRRIVTNGISVLKGNWSFPRDPQSGVNFIGIGMGERFSALGERFKFPNH